MTRNKQTVAPTEPIQAAPPALLSALRDLIQQGRQQALRAVDMVQVQTCWEIGRHIVEFEQGGEERAAYGRGLLPRLAETLTQEFGKGFDTTNLRHMRGFYLAFPIRDALRRELSWTHYRTLLRVTDCQARRVIPVFKAIEFDSFKKQTGSASFALPPKKWQARLVFTHAIPPCSQPMTLGRMVQRNKGGARRAGDIRGTICPGAIGPHKPKSEQQHRPLVANSHK